MKLVLFDLDGTLVRAGGAGRKALNRAIQALYGAKDVCSRFSLAGRTDRQNFHLAALKASGRRPGPAELREVERAYLRRLPSEVRRAVREGLYAEMPGIARLIRALAKREDVALGLGTGNVERGARIKLGPSGLGRYFAFGGYGSDGWTRTRMLKAAVRRARTRLGRRASPEEVYVIGDTPLDVLAAKKAGYRAGAVACGFGEPDALRRAGPELLEKDFRKPRRWLEWINSPPSPPSPRSGRAPRPSRPSSR